MIYHDFIQKYLKSVALKLLLCFYILRVDQTCKGRRKRSAHASFLRTPKGRLQADSRLVLVIVGKGQRADCKPILGLAFSKTLLK